MMDKTGLLDKDLVNLADQANKMFKEKMNIANQAINNLPESESKMKGELKDLIKEAKNKNADHSQLMTKLNKIVNAV